MQSCKGYHQYIHLLVMSVYLPNMLYYALLEILPGSTGVCVYLCLLHHLVSVIIATYWITIFILARLHLLIVHQRTRVWVFFITFGVKELITNVDKCRIYCNVRGGKNSSRIGSASKPSELLLDPPMCVYFIEICPLTVRVCPLSAAPQMEITVLPACSQSKMNSSSIYLMSWFMKLEW